MRNELRRYYGKPPLPPTVAESTAGASPDAAVWQVGEGVPEHVIMVTTAHPLTLHVNGSVTVADNSTDMPRNPGDNGQGSTGRVRRYIARPYATEAQVERFTRLGATWRDVIEAGLKAMEERL